MKNLEKILKVLADKNRMRIIALLEKRKMCVCELAPILGITQPSVSRHLGKLKEIGLIEEEQDSFWTNYYLSKRDNMFVRTLLKDLANDSIVLSDRVKARNADRKKLCKA